MADNIEDSGQDGQTQSFPDGAPFKGGANSRDLSRLRIERLARGVAKRMLLFADAPDGSDKAPLALIKDVTRHVAAHREKVVKAVRIASLEDTVSAEATIRVDAEIFRFGTWLLVNGKPGHKALPGKPADPEMVFKTIATALAEEHDRDRQRANADSGPRRRVPEPGQRITGTALRDRWRLLFADAPRTSDLKSRVRAATGYLRAYIEHLKTQRGGKAGTKWLRSRQLEKVLRLLGPESAAPKSAPTTHGKSAPHASAKVSAAMPSATPTLSGTITSTGSLSIATLNRPIIPLPYSSPSELVNYRGIDLANAPEAVLAYDGLPIASTQKRFANRLMLVPKVRIAGNYSVKAVIDRMILILATRDATAHNGIKAEIDKAGAGNSFVQDLHAKHGVLNWRGTIEVPAAMPASLGHGHVFALLLQEPTPTTLAGALKAIDARWGIEGAVVPYLIEVSLDFYQRRNHNAATRLQLREQMVGLLQRHHHIAPRPNATPEGDARQVYAGLAGAAASTGFLFSSPNRVRREKPDTEVADETVQKRLRHARHANQLFLDATLYKGCEVEGLLFRIQHKIADKRNTKAGTFDVLPDAERRARIEVEISGTEMLANDLGLTTITDLKTFKFRKIKTRFLSFWLQTTAGDLSDELQNRKHFSERGLYGNEVMRAFRTQVAKDEEKAKAPIGTKVKIQRTGTGATAQLIAWEECNEAVGDAVDALTKSWSKFTL